jgi:pimeloyl-ACP methyl ester carboxylesterase
MMRIFVRSVLAVSLLFQCLSAQRPANLSGASMVQVNGRAMRVRTANLENRKPGQPIVVLESGSVQQLENWNPIFNEIAALGPVVAYDRPGIGRSEFDGQPQTLDHVAQSLHELLSKLKASPPYVLVGHSYGGLLIMTFTNRYLAEVAGLVYLDASDPDISYADFDAISPETRRLVMSELDVFPTDLPVGMKAELDNLRKLLADDMAGLHAVRPPKGVPTGVLISAGKYERSEKPLPPQIASGIVRLQIRHQQEWALSSQNSFVIIANHMGHFVHQDDPALVTQVIQRVLAAASKK